jgi:hypothetical protein
MRRRARRHGRCFCPKRCSPLVKERTVTRRPFVVAQPEPLGIVIRSGAPQPKPAKFWAYLWAADEDDPVELHWHQRVPAEHAA